MNGVSIKKAYLVLGIEASGTRLLTRILINSGALGEDTHAQAFDTNIPFADDVSSPIVWRRSYPHGDSDVDLRSMLSELKEKGWMPHAFVIVRDAIPSTNAQAQAPCLSTKSALEAQKENRRQFSLLFSELYSLKIDYHVLTLEGLIIDSLNVQKWIATFHGLTSPDSFLHIRNVNAKHWLSWSNRDAASSDVESIGADSINQGQIISVSLSEFIDKLSILRIKMKRMKGEPLSRAKDELIRLEKFVEETKITINSSIITRLKELNFDLW